MAGVQYKFDTSEVLAGLQKLRERGGSLAPALRSFGEHLLTSHRERFTQQAAPDGTPWAPLSPTYKATKKRNVDKILVLRGYLKGTLAYRATDTQLLFGTNRVYGAIQQFGASKGQFGTTKRGAPIPWGNIPARPFIGVSDEDQTAGLKIIATYLAGR